MSRRTITINIANLSDEAEVAVLSVEAVPEADLVRFGFPLPSERLTIRSGRILTKAPASTLAGCRDALLVALLAFIARWQQRPILGRPLTLRLRPQSTVDVTVAIDVTGKRGAAGLRLVDRRGGRVVGGVTVLTLERVEGSAPAVIPARTPCPVTIEPPTWLPHSLPIELRRRGGPLPVDDDVDLVAWIANPTEKVLSDATAYLEHLGGAPVEFRAARWNLGEFRPGMRFPLRWRVAATSAASGRWIASIVVAAKGFDHTRVRIPIEIGNYVPPETIELEIAEAQPGLG